MASDSSNALISRAQSFVSENRRAIIVGAAAAVAVGGAGYYLYSTRPGARGRASSADGDAEKAISGKKKSKSSKKKKSKDKDGPILEERTPKSVDTSDNGAPVSLVSFAGYFLIRMAVL